MEVADEQSVTSDHETRPAGTPSARKGEGSDKQKAPHNSSTGEERPIERTKSPCRQIGVVKKGTGAASDLKIDTPVATLPGAWRYRVSTGTGRPGVSIL